MIDGKLFKPCPGTEIYVTVGGHLALKQDDVSMQEPQVLLFTADQLPKLIAELQDYHEHRDEWEDGEPESVERVQTHVRPPADPPAPAATDAGDTP